MKSLYNLLKIGLLCTGLSIVAASAQTTLNLTGDSVDFESYRESAYSFLLSNLNYTRHPVHCPKNAQRQNQNDEIPDDLFSFFSNHGVAKQDVAFVHLLWSKKGNPNKGDFSEQWSCTKTSGYPVAKLKRFFDRRYDKMIRDYEQLKVYRQAKIDFLFAAAFKDAAKLYVLSCIRHSGNG